MAADAIAGPPPGAGTAGSQREAGAPARADVPKLVATWRWLPRALHAGSRFLARPRRLLLVLVAVVFLGVGGKVLLEQGSAWYHFRAGKADLKRHHNLRALEHLEACLQTWPRDPDVLLLAARALGCLGDFDKAETYLKQCEASPRLKEDVALQGLLLRAARGDVDGVGNYCRALLDQDHSQAPLLFEAMASGYMRVYRLAEATRYLEEWLKRHPDNPQAHFLQGRLHEQLENYAEAAASFQRVLEVDPDHIEARLVLAGVLLDLNKAQESLPHVERLRTELPAHRLVPVFLARCLDQAGRQAEARTVLDDLLARHPGYPPALAERGKLAVRLGELELAESLLREACLRQPGDPAAHYQLYLCLTLRAKKAEAKDVLKRMNEINDDAEKIREIISRKMRHAPHDPDVQHELGTTLLRTGAVEEGLRWLHSALKVNPKHAPTHRALADFYLHAGEFGRAARHRELAGLERARDNPP